MFSIDTRDRSVISRFSGENEMLSNMYVLDNPILSTAFGRTYEFYSSESVYILSKLPYNRNSFEFCSEYSDRPRLLKSKMRNLKHLVRDDWEYVRLVMMYKALCLKFGLSYIDTIDMGVGEAPFYFKSGGPFYSPYLPIGGGEKNMRMFDRKPMDFLIATKDKCLVEMNSHGDSFYGVSDKTMEGENYLGQMLMVVRALLLFRSDDSGIIEGTDK